MINEDIDSGADWIIMEAREGGRASVFMMIKEMLKKKKSNSSWIIPNPR